MLINKDHLLHQLDGRPEDGWISIKAVRSMIEAAPTIDAIPIIRCKDCQYFEKVENESDAWEWCFYWHEETEEDGYCHKWEE